MVDLGLETEGGRLERVLGWETEMKGEDSALEVVNEMCPVVSTHSQDTSSCTSYGEPLGPSIRIFHRCISASETRLILMPSSGFFCSSLYSLTNDQQAELAELAKTKPTFVIRFCAVAMAAFVFKNSVMQGS